MCLFIYSIVVFQWQKGKQNLQCDTQQCVSCSTVHSSLISWPISWDEARHKLRYIGEFMLLEALPSCIWVCISNTSNPHVTILLMAWYPLEGGTSLLMLALISTLKYGMKCSDREKSITHSSRDGIKEIFSFWKQATVNSKHFYESLQYLYICQTNIDGNSKSLSVKDCLAEPRIPHAIFLSVRLYKYKDSP